ncbi:MAG: 50S ribosomal protein L29 [Mesotoga sp.]|jgi:large subunit ribosomal protein L29|uniref:Large ribosomal subunit protein uL29 n=2 Tax=Mesotoga TaxID=1184396 RepID=A0A3D3TNJ5_9BACT|nr:MULTISPECIES: 50S ribosomal protein L29 [unclassified Mesotoga]KUK78846.1 MAG: 50S ribosomal protein L29 [Mesotoga prima]MDI9367251.1 50S ribosomal protein L29 [Thermotogota bacterium]PNQ05950.1 50S ribosomal protein L29 [Mesotoga sp. SC_NapDC3]PXF35213.1 50S ribosomal protein L29 [Mesotoga sp. SC_NapDC]RAM61412.1 50S ribosomal protein L29 [Mesotoga sp. SC_3PWM13N19]RIZ61399.1 50S ribosomal protein L29 [Mesotoga sp. SC_NapDC2]HCO70269.1 50S ribosomal protein L29 [Mesotoga infera]
MKAVELQKFTDEELTQMLEDSKRKLMDLRFQLEMNRLKNHSQITVVKRDIARIKTILRGRELGIRR